MVEFHSSSLTKCALEVQTHLPFHWKIFSSLNRTSSTICYSVICAFTLSAREKYIYEKFIISLQMNASAMHPSTLASLRIVNLCFFNSLSRLYIHLNSVGSPTLYSQGKCPNKCCIALNHPDEILFISYIQAPWFPSPTSTSSTLILPSHKSSYRTNWVQTRSFTNRHSNSHKTLLTLVSIIIW
jgi:hypothetical protein